MNYMENTRNNRLRGVPSSALPTSYHTEGNIKEITVKGKAIAVKLAPSDEFSFGPDESDHPSCQKLVLVYGSGTDAKLVGLDTEFKFVVAGIDLNMLYALKKDHAKVRAVVEISGSSYTIKEIALI